LGNSQYDCQHTPLLEIHSSLSLVLLSGSSMLLLALNCHWSRAIRDLPYYCGCNNPLSRTWVESAPKLTGKDTLLDRVRGLVKGFFYPVAYCYGPLPTLPLPLHSGPHPFQALSLRDLQYGRVVFAWGILCSYRLQQSSKHCKFLRQDSVLLCQPSSFVQTWDRPRTRLTWHGIGFFKEVDAHASSKISDTLFHECWKCDPWWHNAFTDTWCTVY
jgi:hypothetical protein